MLYMLTRITKRPYYSNLHNSRAIGHVMQLSKQRKFITETWNAIYALRGHTGQQLSLFSWYTSDLISLLFNYNLKLLPTRKDFYQLFNYQRVCPSQDAF